MTRVAIQIGLLLLAGVLFLVAIQPGPAHAAGCKGRIVTASWYGAETCRKGKPCLTANGETFNQNALTAAHKTLPFNTRLRVTYKGKSVVVRLNDRGPYSKGRSLDLSRGAAKRLGIIDAGVARVCYDVL